MSSGESVDLKRSTVMVSVLAAVVLATPALVLGGAAAGQPASARPPACERANSEQPPPSGTTTLTTLGQAYYCVLENYVAGDSLNNRMLLAAAFSGFTSELDRRQLDLSAATMPALTGDRDSDWAVFNEVYQRVLDQLPDDADLHQALAASAVESMVDGLHDNHARWHQPGEQRERPGEPFGFTLSSLEPPDLFVTTVDDGGPAAQQGVRPGDIIRSINDFPPVINGQSADGVVDWLATSGEPVELALERPATGEALSVTLTPEQSDPGPEENVTAARVAGDLAHITFRGFARGVADEITQAVADLRNDGPLSGIVLDVRRNSGGSVAEVARLLGAFSHGRPYGYTCDENYDNCTPKSTDDTVELLGLPLALLTSRGCPSACDAFSAAVRDLELGPIVGTRTAGVVSGESSGYVLDDGSQMLLPGSRGLGPNHEMINEIGVAPDYYIPLTSVDLSAGRDPALDKAVALLHG
jgi:carboxyl-terminal processing protease